MSKIQLTHYCNLPGAEGNPGDVLEVDAALADRLVAIKGAKRLASTEAPAPAAPTPEVSTAEGDMEAPETADAELDQQPESAARRRARR